MSDFNVLILELAKLNKSIAFYPENHPTLINTLRKTTEDISALTSISDFVIEIGKDGFTVKGEKIYPSHPILKDFMQALTLRRVNKIIFHKGLIPEELYSFLKLLNYEVGALFSAGGLEKIMETSSIRNIGLSETHLSKLLSKVVDTSVKKMKASDNDGARNNKEKQNIISLEGTEAQSDEGSLITDAYPFHTEAKQSVAEQYQNTLTQIKLAVEDKNVGELLKGLKMAGDLLYKLDWDTQKEMVLKLLIDISNIKNKPGLPEGLKKEASNFIYNSINEARLNMLIDMLLKNNANDTILNDITKVLTDVSEPAVEALIERLITAEDLSKRRFLINEITKLGDVAYERVIHHLTDERWYVVRNMITILGVFAKPESLPHLFEISKHPDARVRKEVIKTLARFRNPKVFQFLNDLLQKESDDIKLLIIFSLGIMKSKEAIADLIKLLENDNNLSIKKEALIALGRIGDEKVFPLLKNYALKKGFFKKTEKKVLRLAAITALGGICTKDSADFLENLLKDSDPEIRDTAFEALQKVKVKLGG